MSTLRPVYSPRTTLSLAKSQESKLIQKISLNMDKSMLSLLKKQINGKDLGEEEFVLVILKNLAHFEPDLPYRDIKIYRALIEMFAEVTVAKDSLVSWEDLSDYFINKARQAKKDIPEHQECTYSKSNIQPKVKCQGKILKCVYIKSLEIILFCEQNSNTIQILDPKTGMLHMRPVVIKPHKLTVESSSVKREKGKTVITNKEFVVQTNVTIMDFIYVDQVRYNILLCSLSDGVVNALSYMNGSFVPAFYPDNEAELLEFKFQKVPYCLQWDPQDETVYCGCENQTIYRWSFKTSVQSCIGMSSQLQNIVTCMVSISKLQMLASASMDGKLTLWDTVTPAKKYSYKEHTRGILSLAFSKVSMLLFSAGFDHHICVWNPYVQGIIHKINTHMETIISLQITPNDTLLSMDQGGSIQLFKVKTFDPVCTFVIESTDNRSNATPSCICVMGDPHRLAVCGHSIILLSFDSIKLREYADNSIVSAMFHLENDLQLATVSGQKVKKWNLLNGEVVRTFNNQKSDITTAAFDCERSLIFLGTKSKVTVYNSKTMFKISELPNQQADVEIILPFKDAKSDNLVVLIEGSCNCHIYKQMLDNRYQLFKEFSVSKEITIATIIYNRFDNNLVIGTNVGVIGIFDIESGKSIASTSSVDQFAEIVGLHLVELSFLNVLVEVTRLGTVAILLLPPRLGRVYNCRLKDQENGNETQRINQSCIDPTTLNLFVGDEKGFVVAYGLKVVCDQIDLNESKQQPTKVQLPIERLWVHKTHTDSISSLLCIPSSKLIISSGFDKKVRIRSTNGQSIDELKQFRQAEPSPICFKRQYIREVQLYTDFDGRRRVNTKVSVQCNAEQQQYNPRYIYDRIEIKQLMKTVSNPNWKVSVNFGRYCHQKIGAHRRLVQKLKKPRLNVSNNQVLPKLRENLQKNINQALTNIISSEEGKLNTTIQSSTRIYNRMIKTESLPKLDQDRQKHRQEGRDSLILLSKPRRRDNNKSVFDKPKIDRLSKEVVEAYKKLNMILNNSSNSPKKTEFVLSRRKD